MNKLTYICAITIFFVGCSSQPKNKLNKPSSEEKSSVCKGARTPEEQFIQAMNFKSDGKEVEMVACLKPSAEAGYANAQELLGTCYGMGKGGLTMTTVQAEYWYCKSLENGNKDAARGLGLLMSGRLYTIERMELLTTPGYKNKLCDYEVLNQLMKNDPQKSIEKALNKLNEK